MRHLKRIARVIGPGLLLSGCASLPESPAITANHPAHPQAQVARAGDTPSILDSTPTDAILEPVATGPENADHSHHMQAAAEDQQSDQEEGEVDHSHHMQEAAEDQQPDQEEGDQQTEDHSHHGDHDGN